MERKVKLLLINNFSDSSNKKEEENRVRECEAEKKRASMLRLCFSVEFVCWLAGDEEVAAGFFVCDCRQMLDKWQSVEMTVKLVQCMYRFLVWLTDDGEKILVIWCLTYLSTGQQGLLTVVGCNCW